MDLFRVARHQVKATTAVYVDIDQPRTKIPPTGVNDRRIVWRSLLRRKDRLNPPTIYEQPSLTDAFG